MEKKLTSDLASHTVSSLYGTSIAGHNGIRAIASTAMAAGLLVVTQKGVIRPLLLGHLNS